MKSTFNKIGVDSGFTHTIFVKTDGTVWACGNNSYGKLGLGDTSQRYEPTQLQNISDVTKIACGGDFTLFLKSDGTVWSCGYNNYGNLGLGTNDTSTHHTPTQVTAISDVVDIAAGGYSSFFLKRDGTVWSCGYSSHGELGVGSGSEKNTAIRQVPLDSITNICAGRYHTLFRKSNGTVYSTGYNNCYQLGDATTSNRTSPVQVQGISNCSGFACGDNHSLFLCGGSVYALGYNGYGQLGMGNTSQLNAVTLITNIGSDISAVAAGLHTSYFLKSNGVVLACGHNSYGSVGVGNYNNIYYVPTRLNITASVSGITASHYQFFFMTSSSVTSLK